MGVINKSSNPENPDSDKKGEFSKYPTPTIVRQSRSTQVTISVNKIVSQITQKQEITIIGAGLSGLTLAYLLAKDGIRTRLLEASQRVGGRILTRLGALETPLELGATWFSDQHITLISLIDELGLSKHIQYVDGVSFYQGSGSEPVQRVTFPQGQDPSYRIVGGTQMLITALSKAIDVDTLHLNAKVVEISEVSDDKGQVLIKMRDGTEYLSGTVIICLPPQLIAAQELVDPGLVGDELSQLLPRVQTWMGGSIKFVIEYAEDFWRKEGYSGMLFTQSGIISEMHDHTNERGDRHGFTGFLNPGAVAYSQEQRRGMVIQLLSQLLGDQASNVITYLDRVWVDDLVFDAGSDQLPPHHNNGHPLLQRAYLDGKLFFSSTETSPRHAGYMEGAIIAATNTYHRIPPNLSIS